MIVDFARDRQRILDRNPYWRSSASERQAMFAPVKRSQLITASSRWDGGGSRGGMEPEPQRLAVGQ
jgi:hypothetical protein